MWQIPLRRQFYEAYLLRKVKGAPMKTWNRIAVQTLLLAIGSVLVLSTTTVAGTIPLDARQTYLLTHNDPLAVDSPVINLASLGLFSGMTIDLYVTGTICYYWDGTTCQIGPSIPWSMAGVFSSSSNLGPFNNLNRVTGALYSNGSPVFTIPTFYDGLQTDVPQDFSISAIASDQSGPVTQVKIPIGAQYLFVTANDSFFGDNYSTDLELHFRAVPEPSALVILGSGLLAIATRVRRKVIG
jgi:hypothetical protein